MSGDETIKARVTVYPRQDILDPQGKAIQQALGRLGFAGVSEVRAGKSFEVVLSVARGDDAKAKIQQMCQGFLANTVVEDFTVEMLGKEDP